MKMDCQQLGITSTKETDDNDPSINEITIEIEHEGHDASQPHKEIRTIQLQSPGGRSHFVEGLVVTNSTPTDPSTQIQAALVGNDEIFHPDNGEITFSESLGEDATGHIMQMVRLATDENGETIIFVESPQDKTDGNLPPVVVLNPEESNSMHHGPSIPTIQTPLSITLDGFPEHSLPAQQIDAIKKGDVQNTTVYSNKVVGIEGSDAQWEDDDESTQTRLCVVCLRRREFTEDIFDADRNPHYQIRVLFAHLNIQVKATPSDSGVCLECLHYLQQWHIFHSTISERHDYAKNTGSSLVPGELNFHPLETQFYKQYSKLLEVKEIFHAATHAHYARRHLTDKDWDFVCDGLIQAQTDSAKFEELKRFAMCKEKLSKFLCTICDLLIPDGSTGYAEHMSREHNQSPILYPCDICGKIFSAKPPGSTLVDYFEHWVSHFHFKNGLRGSSVVPPMSTISTSSPHSTISPLIEEPMKIEGESSLNLLEDGKTYSKKRKKNTGTSVSRRVKSLQKINQIKDLLQNSPYQHLIRRDLDEDSLDYIADRLLSTKSNSSTKIKEIENMTFSLERMRSVFCEDCRKTISGGKDGYHQHRKLVHKDTDEDLTIPCDICGNFFPEKDLTGLSQNYFTHWILHFYFEECGTCQEKCPNVTLLKKHSLIHQKRTVYPCTQCDKVLAKKVTLEQHIKTHLSEEEKMKTALTCHICGKIITAPSLKAHMFSVHSDERPWKCEVCGVRFKHKSDLSGHRNAVHLKIKKFICNICGKSFGHQCGLRVHVMSHEDKRNHACPTCGKRFLTMWHLKKHIVTHKEVKDVICTICGKGFKKEESLQEHMTIHTGEMPFACHICGRKVRVLSNLYKHFMVHKKNKTYYSKKDGLPDPLDIYIAQQQNKKSVNKIVLESLTRKDIVELSSDYMTEDSMTNDGDIENIFESDLQLNRSASKVITYERGRGSNSNSSPSQTIQNNVYSKDHSQHPDYYDPESGEILCTRLENVVHQIDNINPTNSIDTGEHANAWPKLGPVIMKVEEPGSSNNSQ